MFLFDSVRSLLRENTHFTVVRRQIFRSTTSAGEFARRRRRLKSRGIVVSSESDKCRRASQGASERTSEDQFLHGIIKQWREDRDFANQSTWSPKWATAPTGQNDIVCDTYTEPRSKDADSTKQVLSDSGYISLSTSLNHA